MKEYIVKEHTIVKSDNDGFVFFDLNDVERKKVTNEDILFSLTYNDIMLHIKKIGDENVDWIKEFSTIPVVFLKEGRRKIIEASIMF